MNNNFFTKKNLIIIGIVAFCIILIGSIFSVIYVKNNIIDNLNFEVVAEKSTDSGIETGTNFIITSEKNYSARALKKVIALNPSMDFSLDKVDSKTYVLTPSDKLNDDSIYNVYISKDGEKIDKSWAFQTKTDFKVVSTLPASNTNFVKVNTGVEIYFSKPVSNVEDYFEIVPKVNGSFEYKEKSAIFKPDSLSSDTLYKVTVKKGLKNAYGEELVEDYTFAFRTEAENYSYFNFVDGYESNFRTDEVPDIKISSSEKYKGFEFDINLYKLNSLQEYVNFLEIHHNEVNSVIASDLDHVFDMMSKYSVLSSFKGKLEEIPDSWIETIKFPQALEKGWYIADVRGTTGDLHFQKAIQISDVSVYTYGLNGEVSVWCNDAETGLAITGATVQVGDLAAITNKDGIATFNLTSSDAQRILITTKDGKEFGEHMSLVNKEDEGLEKDYYTYIYTDRERYFPTDTINFWGAIIPRKSTMSIPEKVTVKLDEKEIEVRVNENGVFSGKLEISNHTSTWLTLGLELNGKSDYIRGIEIVDYIKPVYKITSNFDKEYYRGDEPINLNVYGKFYDGTSAENLKLDVKYNFDKSKSVTLDTNGEGKVRMDYTPPQKDGEYAYAYANIEVAGIDEYASSYNSVPYFPTDYNIRAQWDSQNKKLKFKTNKYNYDAIKNGTFDYEKIYEGESFDQKVYVDIIEIESVKRKIGEFYNVYTGLIEARYKYDDIENIISNTEINISKDKEEFLDLSSIERRENCTYEARISFVLPDGYAGQKRVTLFEYRGYNFGDYYFRRDDNYKALKTGESTVLMLDGKNLPQNFRMIYFVSTDKVNTMGVTTSNNVKVTMSKELIPNCLVNGAVFDGKRLQEINTQYLTYDTNEKKLDIEISTDKDVYKPGDTVKVNFLVKDNLGSPVKTEMVVSAVNEATYTNEDYTTPIDFLYKERYYLPKTCISNYYRNFEGGEGGGGDGEEREKFVDVLLFEPITTNDNGKATVEFTTSDDLTSWRITAAAVSRDVKAGIKTKNISTSIPFFINQVINEKYTVNDDVVTSLRVAGSAKTQLMSNNIKYEAKIEGKDTKELTLEPSKVAMFNFGKLPAGKYKITVRAERGEYSDAIVKEIEVVESNSELAIVKTIDISELSNIEVLKYPVKLMFFDKDNGLAYKSLKKVIEQSNGGTNEQVFAKNIAYGLLNEFYGKEVYNVDSKVILQDYTGGIPKISYSTADPLITANICMIAPEKIDKQKAIEYFYGIINNSASMPNDVTAAYMGLAALKQPVLNDIKYLLSNDNGLELMDKINLISSLAYIGDYSLAQKYYESQIQGIMTLDKEYKYIGSDYETYTYKANSRLLTALALTNHSDFKNVLNYVLDNSANDYISALDLLVAINNYMPMQNTKSWMEYELNGETVKVDFGTKKLEVLTLDENEMKSFSIKRSKGEIEVISDYVGKASEVDSVLDKVKIKKSMTNGKLGDYSDVTLEVTILDDEDDSHYLITDFIPLSSRYTAGGSSYNDGWGFIGYENQKINFYVDAKKHKNYTIKYKIRNVFSGEFLAESAFITNSDGMIAGKSNDLSFTVK